MVKLEPTRLIIIIPGSAADTWSETVGDLLDLLYCEDPELIKRRQGILFLLQHMMPSFDQIKLLMK